MVAQKIITHWGGRTLLLWVIAAYSLLGMDVVPFHGDESTTVWMSRDFDTIILQGNWDAIFYQPPPRRTTDQHLRIVTGNFSKFWMGLSWWLGGFSVEHINDQWVWSPDLDLEWNKINGHVPSEKLLWLTRLSSTWMLIVSAAAVYKIVEILALRLFAHRMTAQVASYFGVLFYMTNPAVLLNARRAMFEGGLLLMLALLALWSIKMLNNWSTLTWRSFFVLGVLTGITFTTKHSAVFTVILFYLVLLGVFLKERSWVHLFYTFSSGGLALITMFAFSPMWWNAPLEMPHVTYEERRAILQLQVDLFGGYEYWLDRLHGLAQHTLIVEPQYYEADYWGDFEGVRAEIQHYKDTYAAGLVLQAPLSILVHLCLMGMGLWALWQCCRDDTVLFLMTWTVGLVLITLFTVPLNWQRYYLPLQLPFAILMGIGVGIVWHHGKRFLA